MLNRQKKSADKKKQPETIRERAQQALESARNSTKVSRPESEAKKRRILRRKSDKPKRFHIIPRFFRESWTEIRQVTWPSRQNTFKLSLAVILFSVVFATMVDVVDLGLVKVFRKVLLHG